MENLMEKNPKVYFGVNPANMFIINELQKATQFTRSDILIALRKVRLNESVDILAHTFGVHKLTISRSLFKTLVNVPNWTRYRLQKMKFE